MVEGWLVGCLQGVGDDGCEVGSVGLYNQGSQQSKRSAWRAPKVIIKLFRQFVVDSNTKMFNCIWSSLYHSSNLDNLSSHSSKLL